MVCLCLDIMFQHLLWSVLRAMDEEPTVDATIEFRDRLVDQTKAYALDTKVNACTPVKRVVRIEVQPRSLDTQTLNGRRRLSSIALIRTFSATVRLCPRDFESVSTIKHSIVVPAFCRRRWKAPQVVGTRRSWMPRQV